MALISLRQLLDHAAEHDYGVPAFNVNNLEQTRAIMEAADATNSPVIMQASAGARSYAGAPFLRHLIEAAIEEFPHIPEGTLERVEKLEQLRLLEAGKRFLTVEIDYRPHAVDVPADLEEVKQIMERQGCWP